MYAPDIIVSRLRHSCVATRIRQMHDTEQTVVRIQHSCVANPNKPWCKPEQTAVRYGQNLDKAGKTHRLTTKSSLPGPQKNTSPAVRYRMWIAYSEKKRIECCFGASRGVIIHEAMLRQCSSCYLSDSFKKVRMFPFLSFSFPLNLYTPKFCVEVKGHQWVTPSAGK